MRIKFGGQSMVAPLRSVLVRTPDENFCVSEPEIWHYTDVPDLENAQSEHRNLVRILENLDVEVVYHTEPMPGLADAIFVYDPALITDQGAVVLRMGKRLRNGEERAIAECFKRLGIPILGALTGASLAEGGDMFWIDPRTLAVGLGFRTNRSGAEQIKSILKPHDIKIITADLPCYQGPDACLHLLSLISLVDENLAVIYKPLFPVSLYQALQTRGFTFIEVPEAEFHAMAPNILTVKPGVCIMLEGSPVTKNRLEANGCKVYTYRGLDISLKAEGGPTCLTRPLLRMV